MTNNDIFYLAKKIVSDKYKDLPLKNEDGSDYVMDDSSVFIVWFSHTLQNWKALVGTVVNDGMYYEVTYNGDTNQLYLDSYKHENNEVFDVRNKAEETQEEPVEEESK